MLIKLKNLLNCKKSPTTNSLRLLGALALPLTLTASTSYTATLPPLLVGNPQAETRPWGDAATIWLGHSPLEALGAGGQDFFHMPEIAAGLQRVLLPSEIDDFRTRKDAGRLQAVSHYLALITRHCMFDSCQSGLTMLIFDKASSDLWFVQISFEGGEFRKCWRGSKALATLPPVLLEGVVPN